MCKFLTVVYVVVISLFKVDFASASSYSLCSGVFSQHTNSAELKPNLSRVSWNTISSREYYEYSLVLRNTSLPGKSGPLQPYNESEILQGERNLLSMGEGAATYIKTLIEMRENERKSTHNIHAVDLIYSDPLQNILNPDVAGFVVRHKSNYHSAYFQEFTPQIDGKYIKFDEIISSYALTHMLEKQPELLEHIVLNLLKNKGHLRIWPMYKNLYITLNPVISEMYAKGIITNFTVGNDSLLVIQR